MSIGNRRLRYIVIGSLVAGLACGDTPNAPIGGGGGGPGFGGGGGGGGGGGSAAVSIGDNFYSPQTVTVTSGQTVTWTWEGENGHTVTFDDGAIGGSQVQQEGTFSTSIELPGTFTYFCTVHGRTIMSGSVFVQDS